MLKAKDFRAMAREALKGKWGIAVIAGLLASMLGGVSNNFNVNFETTVDTGSSEELGLLLGQLLPQGGLSDEMIQTLLTVAGVVLVVSLAVAALFLFLGSVVGVGYSQFNLDLVDHQPEADVGTLFRYFKHWKRLTVANRLRGLYVFLWSLLLVIPGIYASYSYAMVSYILAEHPELTAREALARSKEMMEGNRWRLFCLNISFIGWAYLCILTLGIGFLWLTPYMQASIAAFYREISGTDPAPVVEVLEEPVIEDVL